MGLGKSFIYYTFKKRPIIKFVNCAIRPLIEGGFGTMKSIGFLLTQLKSKNLKIKNSIKKILKLLMVFSLGLSVSHKIYGSNSEEYCVAIRGNGEKMPAHWGVMANLIEDRGLPKAMSGGSSASLTIFLIESLYLNKHLKTNSQQSLAVKSFQGYFEALTQIPEGQAVAALLADKDFLSILLKASEDLENLRVSPQLIRPLQKHLAHIETLLQSQDFVDLVNPEFLLYVQTTLKWSQGLSSGSSSFPDVTLEVIEYRKNEIAKSIKNFGKFNARSDETLLFRPGLISFSKLAEIIGLMGDYYAGVELKNKALQKQVNEDFQDFLTNCLPLSRRKSWRQINEELPVCQQLIGRSILAYIRAARSEGHTGVRIQQKIGASLPTFPATSVLVDKAVVLYEEAKKDYQLNTEASFGNSFVVNQEDLRFGYWGADKDLRSIEKALLTDRLTRDDAKSSKFLPLGNQPWLEALSTSPAEPGLANLLKLESGLISAGGWSDLHPTLILRAHGCEEIVYITRKGGESLFAQGVIKKLTNIEGFEWKDWEGLSDKEMYEKNYIGNVLDVGTAATPWSELYNMANPESSIRKSMKAATRTICTDWDNYDPRQDINALIEEAMEAYDQNNGAGCDSF